MRLERSRHVPLLAPLLGEPAWDVMLDLFAAQARGVRVCVSSACAAANVPTSTAMRVLVRLERAGLVHRTADAGDARRAFLTLTPSAFDRLADCLSHMMQTAPVPETAPSTAE